MLAKMGECENEHGISFPLCAPVFFWLAPIAPPIKGEKVDFVGADGINVPPFAAFASPPAFCWIIFRDARVKFARARRAERKQKECSEAEEQC